MKEPWPVVSLGKVITQRKEFIQIDDLATYKRCRVQLHTQGIVLRDTILGAEIKTKKQQVCHAGEFLVAEIDAKVGGFGIVPEGLDGAIVSSHYFLFVLDGRSINQQFLDYFIRTREFRDQITAQGSTNYAAIRPEDVLSYQIPLPPIEDQRRIVARMEELAARIEEARELRRRATEETEALLVTARATSFKEISTDQIMPLKRVADLERGKFSHRPRNDPRFFGGSHPWIQIGEIESADKYIRKYSKTLNDSGLSISRKFPKGTLLISIAATIGAVGILDFDCCIPDSIVAVIPKPEIASEYIYHYLEYVRNHLEEIAPESARKNINLKILSSLPIPVSSLQEQRNIINDLNNMQSKLDALRHHQAETARRPGCAAAGGAGAGLPGGALDHNRDQIIINPLESFYKLPTS